MKENIKKETVKAVLFVLLLLVIGTTVILLTDNGIILIISGMIISSISKVLNKWIDEESEDKQ